MKILVIGLGNPTPSFIKRRVAALAGKQMAMFLVVDPNQVIDHGFLEEVKRAGGATLSLGTAETLFRSALHISKFMKLFKCSPSATLYSQLKWTVKFFPLVLSEKPDLIHLQWLSLANDFHWLRSFFNCPFIASARGSQVTVYPKTRAGYEASIRKSISLVDRIHCVSEDIALQCKALGADEKKLVVNYNGIDLSVFKPPVSTSPSPSFRIISVGSLIWRKGYYYQLQILKQLRDKGFTVELTIVGDGVEKEGLMYSAHLMGVAPYVRFSGQVETSKLPGMLGDHDLYLSTSAAEGLANSVVEAAACGLPIVTFACEGMQEVVNHEVTGYISPFGDVDDVVTRISYLIQKEDVRRDMAVASRKLVEQRFDEKVWVSKMIDVYHELAKK